MTNNQPKSDELERALKDYTDTGSTFSLEYVIRQRQSAHTVEVLEKLKQHMHSNVIVPGISFTKSEYVDVVTIDAAIKEEQSLRGDV